MDKTDAARQKLLADEYENGLKRKAKQREAFYRQKIKESPTAAAVLSGNNLRGDLYRYLVRDQASPSLFLRKRMDLYSEPFFPKKNGRHILRS